MTLKNYYLDNYFLFLRFVEQMDFSEYFYYVDNEKKEKEKDKEKNKK